MNVLFEAIFAEFDADAALKAAVTGLYNTAAPQDTDMPYLVMLLVSDTHEWTFNTDLENTRIQFSIFDKNSSPENIGDIFELLKTCFDDAMLVIGGYDSVCMVRENSNLLRDPEDAWHYVCEYKLLVQKT